MGKLLLFQSLKVFVFTAPPWRSNVSKLASLSKEAETLSVGDGRNRGERVSKVVVFLL